ncbi:MAG: HAMP domain-containing protein [Bacteroidales bacterium]
MHLKIRTKVLIGILFLFIEFLAIGIMSIYYFSSIKNSTELMIKNNYHSVQYAENMIQAIDDTHTTVASLFLNKFYHFDENTLNGSLKKFEENLSKEEKNITEFGEKELCQSIHQMYLKYKSLVSAQRIDTINDKINFYTVNILPLYNEIKAKSFAISTLNMQAIVQKNDNLNQMLNQSYKNLLIIITFCFLFTFSFMFNFPSYIAKPVNEITEKIKEIANKNYKSRIKISGNDEFKELAEAFNYMAEKLEENCNQTKTEAIIKVEEKEIDENKVIENIQSLLKSVRILLDVISEQNKNDKLQQQSVNIQEIEDELSKIIHQ